LYACVHMHSQYTGVFLRTRVMEKGEAKPTDF
jgi:hypothetical protein